MPFTRGSSQGDPGGTEGRAKVAAALRSLDPFSFWVLPSSEPRPGDLIVAGTTGVFLVMPCVLSGALTFGPTGGIVGGRTVPDVRGVRRAAKALQSRLGAAAVYAGVEPVVCLTRALAGAPRTVRGIRYVHVDDLAKDVGSRPIALPRGRAQRAARTLGMHIAGDEHRHFSAR